MIRATKLTTDAPQAQQLATFVASLGVSQSLELYSCENQVYINADVILPVLSVDLKWFHKNAESPIHYLIIKKNTYINRYGMTKLLGQSKQPAAYKLQDYLYELFYRVETDGFVHRDSLVSRKKLLALEDNLETYKSIIENNQASIEEARDAAKAALNDCNFLEVENAKLNRQNNQLDTEIKELTEDLETFRLIANKLARYVRIKATKVPDEAYSDLLEPQDDSDQLSDLSIVQDAIRAKTKLKVESKGRSKVILKGNHTTTNSLVVQKRIHYLLRSAEYVVDNTYSWHITDIEPQQDHIDKSEEFLIGDLTISHYPEIVYRTIEISDDKKNTIALFIEVTNGIFDEATAEKLIA